MTTNAYLGAELLAGRREIPNPDAAPQVSKPLDPSAMMDDIPDTEYQSIPPETRQLVLQAAVAQDRDAIRLAIKSALKSGWITQATVDAINANWLDATIADPNHPAQVPDPQTPRVTVLWGEGGITKEQIDRVLGRA